MNEQHLLSAIAAAPEDARLRLMYADWLEEHGAVVRPQIIRHAIAAAELVSQLNWEPSEPSDLAEIEEIAEMEDVECGYGSGWAWFTEELPIEISINMGKLASEGDLLVLYYPSRDAALADFSQSVFAAYLAGWRPEWHEIIGPRKWD